MSHVLLSLIASAGLLPAGGLAIAKNQHHNNAHNLLDAKLNQNGKHEVGKAGNATVTAEVSNKVDMRSAACRCERSNPRKRWPAWRELAEATEHRGKTRTE